MSELLYRSPDSAAEVWLGDCLSAESVAAIMGERNADALIVDAPYSERTHKGHDSSILSAAQATRWAATNTDPGRARHREYARSRAGDREPLVYQPWTHAIVESFVDLWFPTVAGWWASLTDDSLAPHWSSSLDANGLCSFAPLPFVETGSRVRMAGDGPSSWTCWLCVARPRREPFSKWGTLPGAYVVPRGFHDPDRIVGGKPLSGMLAIVGDYSRHGDLVVDPCCGAGTTGVAARTLGRRFIGIDNNREHAEIAVRRISEAREQVVMPMGDGAEAHQTTMFPAACGTKGE